MDTVFFNGTPMHINGELPKAGQDAPDFALVGKDLSEIALKDVLF